MNMNPSPGPTRVRAEVAVRMARRPMLSRRAWMRPDRLGWLIEVLEQGDRELKRHGL